MATAVKLVEDPEGTPEVHLDVLGLALEGLQIEPRGIQRKTTKFWGVDNESHIFGGRGGRDINVPVLIYDDAEEDPIFPTAADLSGYIDHTLNGSALGSVGVLQITSESDHPDFDDCTYSGATLIEGPKHDIAGNLGGGYWAICILHFRQMS